jgi:uncharacterized protein (TIGR02145 family)
MKKIFLFGLGILISTATFAATVNNIPTKYEGDGLDATEFNSIVEVLDGVHNISGRIGIGTVPDTDVKLDVEGMIKVTPLETGGVCNSTLEGAIYLSSLVSHWYGCNGTSWIQLNNDGGGGSGCTPDCSCAVSTCVGLTCSDGCDGTCNGTLIDIWTPDVSTVCAGVSFEQTSNCGNTQTATGTKNCSGGCEDSFWTPDTNTVCVGGQLEQTSDCGNTRTVDGTKPVVDGGWSDYTWSCTGEVAMVEQEENISNIFRWFTANLFAAALPTDPIDPTDPTIPESRYGVRTCTNPEPSCGGNDCVGSATLTVACGAGEICVGGVCTGETCTPDCSCASSTCVGSTCSDGCGGTCSGTQTSVDGGWSAWGAWYCGYATQGNPSTTLTRSRSCSNPYAVCGGASCTGDSTETISCANGMICSDGACITPSTYYWYTGTWGDCTLPSPLDNTCDGTENRTVECRESSTNNVVADSFCSDQEEPFASQSCVAVVGTTCGTSSGGYTMMCNALGDCVVDNPCLPDHNTTGCDGYGTDVYWFDNCGVQNDIYEDCGGAGCQNGVCLDGSCPAVSMDDNCILAATANGGTSGSCYTGYTGTCSYRCVNGTWSMESSNCVICTTHDHKDCYGGDSWWYNSCNEREDKSSDCLYGCSGAGVCDSFSCGDDSMYDQEGNAYNTVQIGSQCWMEEDMATDESNSGTALTEGTSGEYRVHSGDYLYTLDAANKICPSGWVLPSDSNYKTLEGYLGMSSTEQNALDWRGGEGNEMASDLSVSMAGYYVQDTAQWSNDNSHHLWTSTLSGTGAFCASYAGGNPHDQICYYNRQLTNSSWPSGADDQVNRLKLNTGEPNDYLKLSVRCLKTSGGGGTN